VNAGDVDLLLALSQSNIINGFTKFVLDSTMREVFWELVLVVRLYT
jgi:hypothetical protein